MARTVKVPVLGQSVEEVRIVQWFKKVGDSVAIGEALGELETDKTNMEFVSTEAGTVLSILAAVDAYVKVEDPVVLVGEPGESAEAPAASLPPSPRPAGEPLTGALDASPRARPGGGSRRDERATTNPPTGA